LNRKDRAIAGNKPSADGKKAVLFEEHALILLPKNKTFL
jgi:hypothetical protein